MIRTLVVDDEKLARDRLRSFLINFDDIEVIGEAANGIDAVRLIEEEKPDVIFLDVQMPGLDGFGVLQAVRHRPRVVFATAFDEYAIKAFEVEAADYLLKPISRDRLEATVRRLRDNAAADRPPLDVDAIVDRLEKRQRRFLSHVTAHRARHLVVIPLAQVLWFEVEHRLVYVHIDGERYMTDFSLRELEDRLDPKLFFRAHKSRIVNLEHVKAIVPVQGGRYHLAMNDSAKSLVELSRQQARELRARLVW